MATPVAEAAAGAGLQDMMSEQHTDRADRVMKVMLTMKKIDIQRLRDAYEGR